MRDPESILPAAGSARPFYFIEEKTDCIAVVAAEAAAAASSQQRIPAPSSFPLQAVFFRRYKLRPPSVVRPLEREGGQLRQFQPTGKEDIEDATLLLPKTYISLSRGQI